MPNLRVDPAGLNGLATECGEQAVALRSALTAGSPGPAFQATAAAVATSDRMVRAASQSLADRIDDLSSNLTAAASSYLGRDEQSGEALNQTITGSAT